MGRKNEIEGQLNFFDMLVFEEASNDQQKQSVKAKEEQVAILAGAFSECSACWCATCEHSTVGGGTPRPFGESMRPCPSCELCVSQGQADVCVIGSAEEGCSYRAEKEGM